jgi:hypothetical protein
MAPLRPVCARQGNGGSLLRLQSAPPGMAPSAALTERWLEVE